MDDKTLILVTAMMGYLCFATWASSSGFGLASPERNPPSIREGSVRTSSGGRARVHYFTGGGPHGGK